MLYDNHRLILAPMAGITDCYFRQLCRESGAQLTYTEMVSAKGLSYANKKTTDLLSLAQGEQQVVVQLFGHDSDVIAHQAKWVENTLGESLFALDINMGCPARKIARKGDGVALMDNPRLAAEIVHRAARAISAPVTVKFRRGITQGKDTAVEFAKRMEDAGASAVCIHPRFAEQFYSGQADWSVIARIKSALAIPVVGNGDIKHGADVVRMMKETSCDAVMIGRAAMGNPLIFADALSMLEKGHEGKPPSKEDRITLAKRHIRLFAEGQTGGFKKPHLSAMRRHAMCYVSGMPGAAEARKQIASALCVDDYYQAFEYVLQFDRGE